MLAGTWDHTCVHLPFLACGCAGVRVSPGGAGPVFSGSCAQQRLSLPRWEKGWFECRDACIEELPRARCLRGPACRGWGGTPGPELLEAVCCSAKALISLRHQPPLFS